MRGSKLRPARKPVLVIASFTTVVLLNGCVVLLPNGGGLQSKVSSLKPPGYGDYTYSPESTPPGVEAISGSLPPTQPEPEPDTQTPPPTTASRSIQLTSIQQSVKESVTSPRTEPGLEEITQPAKREIDAPRPEPETGKVSIIPARAGNSSESLWERLVDGFDLDGKSKVPVRAELKKFSRHRRSTRHMLARGKPYLWEITEAVASREMPMELALLPAIESRFNPMAESRRRALGLWQLMPGTADHLGLEQNWWFDARLDVAESTHAALNYLDYLYRRFNDWTLALAAYNCGEARLQRAIEAAGGNTDFWALKLPAETRQYVPRLLALAELIEDPEDYGIRLPDLPDQQTTDTVIFERQVDLALVAEQGSIDLQTLQYLNPGLQRWATPPDGPHRLRVPAGKSRQLQTAMQSLPVAQWTNWQSYLVRRGDSLGSIAQRHGIRIRDLKSINGLKGDMIRAGQSLQLPSTRHLASANIPKAYPPPVGARRIEYQVRSGDTLWGIARMFKVSINALSSWNDLQSGSILRPGKKLIVWVSAPTDTTSLARG